MFKRLLEDAFKQAVAAFPVVVLTGPRQSGKTTLIKYMLPDFSYFSLESPDILLIMKSDPRAFLKQYMSGLILDEAQRYPEVFSYIQELVDANAGECSIVLSGSQNFLMAEQISQTLAGRAAIFELLPLNYQEYRSNKAIKLTDDLWQYLFAGSYPRPYQEQLPVKIWYDSYIRTYLERDVRSLINVKDLSQFQLFLKFCAAQHGQEFNATSIANNIGVSQTTVMNWLSILEASYVVFRLQPYYKNYKKRLSKRSKLYFYDSAIVCHLLGVDSLEHLMIHSSRGAIFEGFVISEIAKLYFAKGQRPGYYYWREHSGHEIDLLIEVNNGLVALEIKSSATLSEHCIKGLNHIVKIIPDNLSTCIIYGGQNNLQLGQHKVMSWQDIPLLLHNACS